MAVKAVKTRNSERRSGKAWGKNHVTKAKALTQAAQERRAHRAAELAKEPRGGRGPNFTMPKITWEWAEESVVRGRPKTRRLRVMEAYSSEANRSQIEANPTGGK